MLEVMTRREMPFDTKKLNTISNISIHKHVKFNHLNLLSVYLVQMF